MKRLSGLAGLFVLAALPAVAEQDGAAEVSELERPPIHQCIQNLDAADYLGRAFHERRVASALNQVGNRVEIFASRRGTWTMIEIFPEGLLCVRASGTRMHIEQLNDWPRPDS